MKKTRTLLLPLLPLVIAGIPGCMVGPDYVRPERRIDTFHDYEQLLVAIKAGRADAAEVLMRKIMTDTRDEVLGYMAQSHSDVVDPFRQQVY